MRAEEDVWTGAICEELFLAKNENRNKQSMELVESCFRNYVMPENRKLFREAHREVRLKNLQPGTDSSLEVRPLSLTPSATKLIRIKDTKLHESK